jgi:hypothetical protein
LEARAGSIDLAIPKLRPPQAAGFMMIPPDSVDLGCLTAVGMLFCRPAARKPATDKMRPLHDRQVSDSMLETALGWGDGAA